MCTKTWGISQDGSIQFQQLTSEYLEEAVDMMEEAFYLHENICKAIGVSKDSKAISELKELTRAVARDGITVIAVDKDKNKVVGASFNRIQVNHTTTEHGFLDIFAKTWKQPGSQALLEFIAEIEELCNLFEHCQVESLLEIMFLGTLPEYRGRGIAKKLCEISIEIAQKLHDGVNVKVPIDGESLPLEPLPQVVSSIFSSFISQRIGEKLGFTVVLKRSYELFEFEGKSFASVIGGHTEGVTLEYRKLQ